MFARNSKVKKISYASVGVIYGVGFGAIVLPVRFFIHLVHDMISDLRRWPVGLISIFVLTIDLLSVVPFMVAAMGIGIWCVGKNTAIAWYNRGWKAATVPNELTRIFSTTPSRLLTKAVNNIIYMNEHEQLEDAMVRAINMSTVIQQQSKSLPIEITALITGYLGVEIPDCADVTKVKTIEVNKKQLDEYVKKLHSSNVKLCHRFFPCLKQYKENVRSKSELSSLTLEKKEETVNSANSSFAPK